MELVILESRYRGDVEEETQRNVKYAQLCMYDCFTRNEAPFASHLLYTQENILDDDKTEERELGIDAGLLWGAKADKTVVYEDFGYSEGMLYGIENAEKAGRSIEKRKLPPEVFEKHFGNYLAT